MMIKITIWIGVVAGLFGIFLIVNALLQRAITKIRNWAFHRKQDRIIRDRIF